jgi:hypothetical protein
MLIAYLRTYLGAYRRLFLAAMVAGAAGCHSDNQVSCPATLEPCPATVPVAGTGCADRGAAVFCEYGDDPAFGCNMNAYCDPPSGWIVQSALPAPNCPSTANGALAGAGCPAARPLAGTACSAPCTKWGSGICDGQSMACRCGTWQPVQCTE